MGWGSKAKARGSCEPHSLDTCSARKQVFARSIDAPFSLARRRLAAIAPSSSQLWVGRPGRALRTFFSCQRLGPMPPCASGSRSTTQIPLEDFVRTLVRRGPLINRRRRVPQLAAAGPGCRLLFRPSRRVVWPAQLARRRCPIRGPSIG